MPHASRRTLLGAALATIGTAATAGSALALDQSQDAEIIALSAAVLAGHEEAIRLSRLEDELGSTAEAMQRKHEIRARQEVLTDEGWDMRARLAAMRPATQAGLQAKARVAREFSDVEDLGSAYNDEALLWSVANDVLGVPSQFRDEEDREAAAASSPVAAARRSDAELVALCNEYVALEAWFGSG